MQSKTDQRVLLVDDPGAAVGVRWKELQEHAALAGRQFWVAAPLSSTPLPVYRWLVANARSIRGWDRLRFVLMDEQLDDTGGPGFAYVPPGDPASYEGFARRNFLQPLHEETALAHDPLIKPAIDDLDGFGLRLDRRGGLDLVILALGVGGNYANVMPGTGIATGWHVTALSDEYRAVHTNPGSRSYAGATFRRYGMSLGPRQILQSRTVIVVVTGAHKRLLFRQLMAYRDVHADFPLSIIHHSHVRERVTLMVTGDVVGASG